MGYFLGSRLRRWMQNPDRIVGPYVKPGQTVADIGCGPGLFAVAMAKLVGPTGRVIAIDIQQKMLDMVRRRATREGVVGQIDLRQCQADTLGLALPEVDFVLAMAVIHEVPNRQRLMTEVAAALKPTGLFLICEPRMHVWQKNFAKTLRAAQKAGLEPVEEPRVSLMTRTVLLRKAAK
jgi:ubiquinone/menaquinone biosynthesis C-methylase UbiE